MAEQTQTDELEVYNTLQSIITCLLKIDAGSRRRIYGTVGAYFGFDDAYPDVTRKDDRQGARAKDLREPHFSTHEEPPSPKDFLYDKKPGTDAERVACLAYYLAHYRDTPHFKTIDISKLNTEAAQIKFSNPSHATWNATRSGLLASAAKGMRQLSAYGERYVNALPDRAAVKEEFNSPTRPRRPRKKNNKDEKARSQGKEKTDE